MRVLHCAMSVGGNPQGLARAERELGRRSWSVAFEPTYFDYKSDEVLMRLREKPLLREVKRWLFLRRAIRDFDIVHFNFGRSIMPESTPPRPSTTRRSLPLLRPLHHLYGLLFELIDLPLLKKTGRGIVVTYQGDGARQEDFCLNHFEIRPAREVEQGYYSAKSDAHKRHRIEKF